MLLVLAGTLAVMVFPSLAETMLALIILAILIRLLIIL